MSTPLTGSRAYLFVPGDRPERFDRAAGSGAVPILDLEDAVAPGRRAAAREHVRRWLDEDGRAVVRVQAAHAPGHEDDVAALAGSPGLMAVMLARAEDPGHVRAAGEATGGPVIALVETAAGIAAARELARASARLALGDQDLALDLGVTPRSPLVRQLAAELVLASRLAGLPAPLDGVTTELDAPDVLAADARAARENGFGGKLCIHPRQVEVVGRAWRPSAEELAWARAVVATAGGDGGVGTVGGAMVDRPLVERARALLADAAG
ncbi:citrate lyase subunit beta / citryl-CoA lyase [Blastococcus sp. DSM 46786]|uniref:HpcH/HpaI aldolase/citrate lyase family protein n=1 Tax=Blastococcus sp. DSM 46786 TaxID=1798227 RepID=UPI0008B1FEEA|nr:CoA ester lyase [Blastococcus sp. DSM 46786]SEK20195.1 citrate lyase subunit beta / citryl-CoA lyase [Blastococcus sp. DSM 46786]